MDFTLNGKPVELAAQPDASLLDVLRDGCGLRSMKDGCAPEGSCGACTVMVDGRAVVSCAQPAARVQGRDVLTLEGLPEAIRATWRERFVATGAVQCGFCSPGIVMKAEALLRREPAPDRDTILRTLAGNLCRCTGYLPIVEAIEQVAAIRRGEAIGPPASARGTLGDGVGARAPGYETADAVTGDRPFVGDMVVDGMIHGALRYSDHPRAVVRHMDTRRAAGAPGVVAVITWRDVPGERVQGLITADWPVFVAETETTRYVGDVLAAVAATSRAAARAAAALIDVEYDVLEPIADPETALSEAAPALHAGGNQLSRTAIRRGDVDAALVSSAHVLTETFTTQRIEHAFLEPEAALAVPESGERLHVYSQGQGAWEDRRQLASLLGLPATNVRVTQVPTGGAFGGKEDLGAQGPAALLAWHTGRPVLLRLSRAESLRFHPKRHPLTMTYTVGCSDDGRLTAVRARIIGDTGAYASVGAKVLERAAGHACGAYRVPAVDIESRAVYTNNPPCGAMRGFGVPQVTFAMEGMLDRLAERLGLDGWAIRWRNALEPGDRSTTGQRLGAGIGLKQTLLAVRDAYRGARFAGIACGLKNTGIGNGVVERGRVILRPAADGTIALFHSWTEMGQGIHTVLRQIASEELAIAADRIRVIVDTEVELDTGETTASRATVLGGHAVVDASRRLLAACPDRRFERLAGRDIAGEHIVDWTTAPEDTTDEPVTHIAYGWATQVVVLDEDGRLRTVIAAQDVGRAINPQIVEGQIVGGVHMGLGYALTEAFDTDAGHPAASAIKELGILPAGAMPDVEPILIEEPQREGPFGAKGAGEAVLVPTAAAVAGALFAFDGIRRSRLPMRDSSTARLALPRLAATTRREGGARCASR